MILDVSLAKDLDSAKEEIKDLKNKVRKNISKIKFVATFRMEKRIALQRQRLRLLHQKLRKIVELQ